MPHHSPAMNSYQIRSPLRVKESTLNSSPSHSSAGGGVGSFGMPSPMDEEARRAAMMGVGTGNNHTYSVFPSGLTHRGSYSGVSSGGGSNSASSSISMSAGHPFPPSTTANIISPPPFLDSQIGGLNMPPPNPPLLGLQLPIEPEAQRRAATACNFCRGRKLRCDGNAPCRQCARRELTCVFSQSNVAKRKKRGNDDEDEDDGEGTRKGTSPDSQRNSTGGFSQLGFRPSKLGGNEDNSSWPPTRKRSDRPEETESKSRKTSRNSRNISATSIRNAGKVASNDDHFHTPSQNAVTQPIFGRPDSTTIGLMVGEDKDKKHEGPRAEMLIAPIPTTSKLCMDWWDHLTNFFGPNKGNSTRIITNLLRRFVQSNAIFFGLLHAPTLLEGIRTPENRHEAYPALYFGVLAVAVCDLQSERLEPWTASMEAAKGETRRISQELSDMGRDYLFGDLICRRSVSVAVGQAASILALIEPNDSPRQLEYIRLLQGIVASIDKAESVTIDPKSPLAIPQDPSSEYYYQRPARQPTPQAEIDSETLTRLCWSSVSHRCRLVINRPDQDYEPDNEIVTRLRPSAFWEPSRLPDVLSSDFYRSNDFMRAGKELCAIQHGVWSLPGTIAVNGDGNDEDDGSSNYLSQASEYLIRMDRLEIAFSRYRYQNEAERQSIMANSAEMLCRVLVATRMSLWRKSKLFSSLLSSTPSLPTTIEYWIDEILHAIIEQVEQDTRTIQIGGDSTILESQLDSHHRHLKLANQIRIASQSHPMMEASVSRLDTALRSHMEAKKGQSGGLPGNQHALAQNLFQSTLFNWNEMGLAS